MDRDQYVTAEEFLEWAIANPEAFEIFYNDAAIYADVEELEVDDYFGTEGFNKRFS